MKWKYLTIVIMSLVLLSVTTNGLFTENTEALSAPDPEEGHIIGEVGRITLQNTIDRNHFKTVNFQGEYTDPVVVAFIMTRNGGQSVDVRVRNVKGTSCEIFMQTPSGSAHVAEEVGYMVMETGVHTITDDSGQGILVEAGTVVTSDVHREGDSYQGLGVRVHLSLPLSNYTLRDEPPAVLHTLNTHNNGEFMTSSISRGNQNNPHVRNLLEIRQEAAGSGSQAAVEKIGWIAIESILDTTINGVRFRAEGNIDSIRSFGVDDTRFTYYFRSTFTADSVIVVCKGNSARDSDGDGYWTRGSGLLDGSKIGVFAEEDQVGDEERSHPREYLSFLVVNGETVFREIDSDGDGLSDILELRIKHTETQSFTFDKGYDNTGGGGPIGGGGCPYVSPWNGTDYQRDNNILIASEHKAGVVDDNYILRNNMVPKDGHYYLKIEEFENTVDFFDTFSLYTIDHREGYSMGTTPDYEYITYKDPVPPVSAYDGYGQDVLEYVSDPDSEPVHMPEGSSVVLNYGVMGNARWRHQKLVVRSHGFESYTEPSTQGSAMDTMDGDISPMFIGWGPPAQKTSLYVSLRVDGSEWVNVTVIHPRNHPSDIVIPLRDVLQQFVPGGIGEVEVYILSTQNHYLDFVGLDNSVQTSVNVQEAPMVSAMLNGVEDVTDTLLEGNEDMVTIIPGEHIILKFGVPRQRPGRAFRVRDFMLYSHGYYVIYDESKVETSGIFAQGPYDIQSSRLNKDGTLKSYSITTQGLYLEADSPLQTNSINNNILSHGPYHVQEWRLDDLVVPGFVQNYVVELFVKSASNTQEYRMTMQTPGQGTEFIQSFTVGASSYTVITYTREFQDMYPMAKYNDGCDWVLKVESVGHNVGMYINGVNIEFTYSPNPWVSDTNGDGIPDGDGLLKYGICLFSTDTSGNGLSDYDEIYVYGTDPLKWDTSGNGLSDYEEIYVYGTDPLRWDTSGNGLSDYQEIQYGTDPLKWDTSGDGISDYDAIHGYETVYLSYDEDGNTVETTVWIDDADPHEPYKNVDGAWRDTTGDGIPDVIASDPSRMYESRFNDLPWIECMRRFEQEFNNTGDEDEQEIYDSAFNPNIMYNGIAIIEDISVRGRRSIWPANTWAEVTIELYDPTGIDYIRLTSPQETKTINIDPSDVNTEGLIELTTTINTDVDDWFDSWNLDIEVMNNAGNLFERTRNVDGAISYIWQIASYFASFATWIWNHVTSALKTAAAAVSQLAEALADWVKAQISTLFSAVVNPIISGLQSWANTIEYHMTQFFSELAKWDTLDGDESVSATMNAGSAFMLSFMGQQDKAEQITDVLMYVMNFIEPFQKYVNPMGAMTVIAEALGNNFDSGVMDYITDIKNVGVNSLGQALGNMLDIIITPSFMGLTGFDKIGLVTEVPSISINGIKNFIQQAGLNNEIIDIVCTAFENVDWSGITEDTANSVMIAVSLYLLFESFKTTMVGLSPSIRSVVDTVNSATALIMSLASAAMNNYLIGGYLACVGVITAFFGQIFSALSGNIPTFLINLALMPANIAAYGVSIYHAS